MLALLVTRGDMDETLRSLDWSTLLFFVGLFMLVAGLEEQGVLAALAARIAHATGSHPLATCLAIMWGGAAVSGLIDNIPFVAAMIPVVQTLIPDMARQVGLTDPAAIQHAIAAPMWWSLALGACLGGNGTLLGSSANIVGAEIAARHGRPIGFGYFTLYGAPLTVLSLLICSLYVYLRYFAFTSVG